MAQSSPIEWTNKTWNPVRGCSRVSPGCGGPNHEGGCYAEKIAARFSDKGQAYEGLAERTPHGGRWTGKIKLVGAALEEPFAWRRPQLVFVNSMSDLFHPALAVDDIAEVFGVMAVASQVFLSGAKTLTYGYRYDPPGSANKTPLKSYGQKFGPHTFQVLTKRSDRMRAVVSSRDFQQKVAYAAYRHAHDRVCAGALSDDILSGRLWPLPNVWLGVSVEDQQRADERIPDLLGTPAAIRFLSAEPLLGLIEFTAGTFDLHWPGRQPSHARIDWVITGGESGPRARPMHPDWARSLRDQCTAAGVPFFFKQWGEWAPGECADFAQSRTERTAALFGDEWDYGTMTPSEGAALHRDDEPDVFRIGKKRAGRLLDGRTWNEMPKVAA